MKFIIFAITYFSVGMKKFIAIIILSIACGFAAKAKKSIEGYNEILAIVITDIKCDAAVECGDGRSCVMLSFGGYCDNEYFNGTVLPGAFDCQKTEQGATTLSARYVLKGRDRNNDECTIFIENNARAGAQFSHPTIYTDSKALSFLNKPGLIGFLDNSGDFTIRIFAPATY